MEVTARLYPDMDRTARIKTMTKLCLRVEEVDYSKPLTTDELTIENSAYSREGMRLDALEKEKKEVMATFTEKIKAVKAIMAARLEVIMDEKRKVNGKVFLFADQQGGKMNSYDQDGILVISRLLREEEKKNQFLIGDNADQVEKGIPNDHDIQDVDFVEEKAGDTKTVKGKESKKTGAKKPEKVKDEILEEENNRRKSDTPAKRAESETEKKIKQMSAGRRSAKEKGMEREKAQAAEDLELGNDINQIVTDVPQTPWSGDGSESTDDLPDPNK